MAEIIPIKKDIPNSNLTTENPQTSNTPVTSNQANTEVVDINSTAINPTDIKAPLPQSSKITIENVDFTRIANSRSNAEAGIFLDESSVRKEYWTDLEYKLSENGVVEIYNQGTMIAFTDKRGINLDANTAPQQVPSLEPEPALTAKNTTPNTSPTSSGNVTSINNNDIILGVHETTGNTTYKLSSDVYAMLAYVIQHEARSGSYEDCLASLSCVLNRVEDPRFPNNVYDVLTAPDQFDVWDDYANANWSIEQADKSVIDALNDGLNNGKRNVDTVEWRANYSTDVAYNGDRKFQVVEGGNKYFHKAQHIDRISTPDIEVVKSN